MTEELKKYFRHLIKLVDGLHAIIIIDKEGVPILKVHADSTPALFMQPRFLSTPGIANDQASKLGLGENRNIIAMYQNTQIITFNQLPVIVTFIASASANTGMILSLEKEMNPILQDLRPAVDTEQTLNV